MISSLKGAFGRWSTDPSSPPRAASWGVPAFLLALGALLLGYMFLGRGFAHVGRHPVYVGEVVLVLGVLVAGVAVIKRHVALQLSPVVVLLLAFMTLGAAHTVPYLGAHGTDALRDAVLWGYGAFALLIYLLADRALVFRAADRYSWVVPVFAIWLPISYAVFARLSADPDGGVPLVFFKSGDMAVHMAGVIAFLVLLARPIRSWRTLAWRAVIAIPLVWAAYIVASTNRGGLLAIVGGLALIAAFGVLLHRSRNWIPLTVPPAVVALVLVVVAIVGGTNPGAAAATPSASALASAVPTASAIASSVPPAAAVCDTDPASGSLAANSGFEIGTRYDGTVNGWEPAAGLYSIVEGGFRGNGSASIQNTGEAYAAAIKTAPFPFQAGHALSVSFRAKAIEASPVVVTHVLWFDGSGARISSPGMTSLQTDGRAEWQESSGVLIAPDGTVEAQVQLFEAAGHATLGVDEVIVKSNTMTCDPDPASRSLATNSGFEIGTRYDGTVNGWEPAAGLYSIVEGGFRGNSSASIQNTGEAYAAAIKTAPFPFQAGHALSVSFRAKAIEASPVVVTHVLWFDGSGARISSPGMTSLETNGRAEWQESSGVLTAPDGTVEGQVQLFEAAGHATLGIDEVIVKSNTATSDPDPASRSLATNPGFEIGTLHDGTIEGWEPAAGLYATVEGGFRGERFASIENTGTAYTAAIKTAPFPVRAGDDIFVSFHARAIDARPIVVTHLIWFDGSGGRISSPGMTSLDTQGRMDWQESSGALPAPEGAVEAQVQLFEAAGHATLGVDEVIVRSGDFVVSGNGRFVSIEQIVQNVRSIFTSGADSSLEGTREFRLRWWSSIIGYTVFGEYFWTGKGFGVNLADDDGFQVNQDGSLRAPHNSHMTVLARMGVPGFLVWTALQLLFLVGMMRSILTNRRAGNLGLAALGAVIVAYWAAMMINSSFDPYLEGPQGGIWFWSVFGLGMVIMRFTASSIPAVASRASALSTVS